MKVIKLADFQKDIQLRNEISELIEASYIDSFELLKKEYERNSIVYIIRNDVGLLIAFFMVGIEQIDNTTFIYLGLSAVRHEYKNTGIGKAIYLAQIEDSIKMQEKIGAKVLCWATTATPSAFNAVHTLWEGVCPDSNYNYTPEALEAACLVCRKYNYRFEDGKLFVLKNVAFNTRYSNAERSRINRFVEKTDFQLFKKLNLEEHNGDRLLLILYLPTMEKLNSLKSNND